MFQSEINARNLRRLWYAGVMAHTQTRLALCIGLIGLMAAFTPGQDEQDQSLLRGPAVPEHEQRTLVHEGMRSGFQRVQGRPEVAAVRLLSLAPERMAAIDEVFREHDWSVALMLVDRIDDVRVISDATIAGDRERARELLASLWKVHDPKQERSPLLKKLEPHLMPEERAEVTRLVDEYWDAWIDSQAGDMNPQMNDGQRAERRERVERRLAFQLFQEEVQQGYELTLRRYRDALDAIYAAIEPTEEQREVIRSIVLTHIKSTRLEATQAQRRAVYHEMYRGLDPERQQRLFDYMLRQVLPGD